jgi:hypothetical protein
VKTTKLIVLALILGASMLLAGSAQAYTVYNHVDLKVCIIDAGSPESCNVWVAAGATYHSEQGDAWKYVWIGWEDPAKGDCRLSQKIFTIPQQGSAKVYQDKVETYGQDGKLKETVAMKERVCGQSPKK